MAITWVGIGALSDPYPITAVTPAWPASYTATADDYALLFWFVNSANAALSDPSSWTVIDTESSADWVYADPPGEMRVYYRKLAGGETLPSLNPTTPATNCASVAVVRGVDLTTPMDATAVSMQDPSDTTFTPTAPTTVTNGALVVTFMAFAWNSDATVSGHNAQGFTVAMNHQNGTNPGGFHSSAIAYKVIATAGAVTGPTWVAGGDPWVAITFALRPAGAAASAAKPPLIVNQAALSRAANW